MKWIQTAVPAFLALLLFASGSASGAGFSEISITPQDPIPEGSQIVMTATGWTDGSSGYLYAPTAISITGTSIEITLNVTSACAITTGSCAAVVLPFQESVALGVLASGDYDLDVELLFTAVSPALPGFPFTTSLGLMSTSFTVVPEPSAAILLGAGLALLTRRTRH